MTRRNFQNLYIHVPFCAKKCDYCAFFSVENSTVQMQKKYLDRLRRDLEKYHDALQNLNCVYFGGGTPTLLPPELFHALMENVFEHVRLNPSGDKECTTEANPETVSGEHAEIIGKYLNRVSMGVQSFQTEKRAVLGRRPATADSVYTAVSALEKAGLHNLGIDLIYAAPGETLEVWTRDLLLAKELPVKHISTYSLTPEERTPYAEKYGLASVDEDLSSQMWHRAAEILSPEFERYEVSNFARPGFEAKNNWNVWHGESYLGLGPSGASFDGTDRWTEQSCLDAWLNGDPPEMDCIPRPERIREILMMGLRTVKGWTREQFTAAAGCTWVDAAGKELESLRRDGLLTFGVEQCAPTEKGLEFWNEIAFRLI